jgi:hypothetical protein
LQTKVALQYILLYFTANYIPMNDDNGSFQDDDDDDGGRGLF